MECDNIYTDEMRLRRIFLGKKTNFSSQISMVAAHRFCMQISSKSQVRSSQWTKFRRPAIKLFKTIIQEQLPARLLQFTKLYFFSGRIFIFIWSIKLTWHNCQTNCDREPIDVENASSLSWCIIRNESAGLKMMVHDKQHIGYITYGFPYNISLTLAIQLKSTMCTL